MSRKRPLSPGSASVSSSNKRQHQTQAEATVEASADAPAESPVVISKDLRSYFTSAIAKRLTGFATVALPDNHCYAVSNWPGNLNWGRRQDNRDGMSSYLCIDNHPVLVWIVAELHKASFRDNGGKPARCPTVRIQPLLPADLELCINKLQTLSNPVIRLNDTTTFLAKKWMVGRNEPESNVTDFSKCYDATISYKEREPIPCYSFKEGDIVLVETFVHRYRDWELIKERGRSNSAPGSSASTLWSYWITDFELSALNLLVKAPQEEVSREIDNFDL